jgi:hypothetical protein
MNDTDLQVCKIHAIAKKGLLLQSTVPVSVYVDMETADGYNAAAFFVLPTNLLGNQYRMNLYDYELNVVIALHDNTNITIGTRNPIILNRMEAYAAWYDYPLNSITANNTIALVYHSFMALPSIYKATEFPLIPDPNCCCETVVAVHAFEDNTYVMLNGVTRMILNASDMYPLLVGRNPSLITTSKKAQLTTTLVQVISSTFYLSGNMSFHTMTHTPFHTHDPIHTLAIIAPTASTGEIALDGVIISAFTYKRIFAQYYYVLVPVSHGQHILTTTTPNIKYTASVCANCYAGQEFYGAEAKFHIGLDLPISAKMLED